MLNSETKRHIDAARDVLVGVAPNPTTQIDQITYALIYKFMDDMDQSAIKAGGNPSFFTGDLEPYAWSKLSNTRMGNQEKMNLYSEALTKFSEAKQLPELFRVIFKAAFLPYRSPETLGLFLKEISYFDYSHPEELGNAYEYLLSIMSAQGDAGQFRTPRHIIDFIVEVLNPTKDDKVLDPSCGTAGFLVSTYNHILKQHDGKDDPKKKEKPLAPDERKKLMQNLQGYDIDPTMVRIAQVNMYLHQFKNPQIFQYDTLTNEERWNEKFDVILANPPFMTPKGGIKPHNKFSLPSNRAEVLFVDYIVNHLRPKGRAGIIVPEGIIFQSGNAYKALRKNLVENGLYAVISLPGGVFQPYSGVKTSILFFDNELAKHKSDIAFVKISADGYDLGSTKREISENDLPLAIESLNAWTKGNSVENAIFQTVSKKQIKENSDNNLSGERYKIATDYSAVKWPMAVLGEIATVQKGSTITQKTTTAGTVPVIAGGQQPAYFHNVSNRSGHVITVSASGAYAGFINYFEMPIFASDCSTIQSKDETKASTRYIYFVLKSLQQEIYKFQQGGGQPHVYPKDLVTIQIPLPVLEVQEQIVTVLEGYASIISGAKQIIENWKPSIPNGLNWDVKKIEDICQIGDGNHSSKYPKSSEMLDQGVKFVRSLNISNGELIDTNLIYISPEKHKELKKGHLCENDVLVTNRGEIGKVAIVSREFHGANLNSQIAWLRPKGEVNSHFLLYSLLSPESQAKFKQLTQGSTLQQLTIKQLSQIEIPLPDLRTQEELVKQIDEEKDLINSSKNLIRLFESRTREVLAKLWNE
jgi:type I restriction enzyme M protein